MNASPEKMLASARAVAEGRVNDVALASGSLLSMVEHLTALNLNTARAALDDTIVFQQSICAAREPRDLLAIQVGSITPALKRGFDYGKSASGIASLAQVELFKLVEAGMSQWLQGVIVTLETLNRAAPGSELAVKVLKTAVANASSAYEGASEVVKQVSEVAQANADQAAAVAVDAVSKTTSATVSLFKSAA